MRTSRSLGLIAGTAAIVFATLTVAAPASAATLPPGQKITIVEVENIPTPGEGQFFTVNPANAASTPVGTGSGEFLTGLEVNDDGIGFAIGTFDHEGEIGFVPTLWDADANTGTISNAKPLHFAPGDYPDSCEGIDLNPTTGELLIACEQYEVPELGSVSTVSSVDKTTGLLTAVVLLNGEDFQPFDALAYNAVTGVLWGFGQVELYSSFIIDRTEQSATPEATMDYPVYGADFDRNGQLFLASELENENDADEPSLAVTDPASDDFTSNETFVDTSDDTTLIFVAALTVWGKLAATGSTPGEVAPIAIGSALLLLAGAAFIATSRVSRRKPV